MAQRTGLQTKRRRASAIAPTAVLVPPSPAPAKRDDILKAMSDAVVLENPSSTAEALRALRNAYPDYPLALRLAALAVAMKRPQAGVEAEFQAWS